jgi:hypothetical protein
MRFARWMFLIAGIYGILVLVPGLFMEQQAGEASPPAIAHPEFYYGFFGSALVWQFMFLLIASNPQRWRPLMLIAVLEKAAFFLPCLALYLAGRMDTGQIFMGGMIDGVLMVLFALAWLVSGRKSVPGAAS